jgi:hypothetical protein
VPRVNRSAKLFRRPFSPLVPAPAYCRHPFLTGEQARAGRLLGTDKAHRVRSAAPLSQGCSVPQLPAAFRKQGSAGQKGCTAHLQHKAIRIEGPPSSCVRGAAEAASNKILERGFPAPRPLISERCRAREGRRVADRMNRVGQASTPPDLGSNTFAKRSRCGRGSQAKASGPGRFCPLKPSSGARRRRCG